MLNCSVYENIRKPFCEKLYENYPNLKYLSSDQLFLWIMTNEDVQFINSLSDYLKICFEIRKSKKN